MNPFRQPYIAQTLASLAFATISLLSPPALASGKPDTQATSDTIRVLASDAFGGRAPGTEYETKTIFLPYLPKTRALAQLSSLLNLGLQRYASSVRKFRCVRYTQNDSF
jgi:hypothetical protein|tara:strand:- start:100 stop:426 length:327 start_codon:yes stop_codon:yes gene_type:complete